MMVRYRLILCFVLPLAIAMPNLVKATFVKDVWGVITDPLKLRRSSTELSNSVDRALSQLRELEVKSNIDVTDRLNQIKGIVQTVIEAVDRNASSLNSIISTALDKMRALEEDIYKQAIDLVYRSQCLLEVAATDQLQRALAQTISNIIKSDPNVSILGIRIIDINLKSIEITDPDKAYRSTKRFYLDQLGKTKEADPAFDILSGYQNMVRFANFARCHYINSGLSVVFVEEQNEFERLSLPWLSVVRPSL